MNQLNVCLSLRNLLALGCALCCQAPAVAQTVVRGAVPGWPGNTAYYAPQNVYQYAAAQPIVQVQSNYAPQPAYNTYYAPAAASRIAYAVPAVGSYQVSYAGANQPGMATTAYYGGYSAPVQRVAYMPQPVYYRPVAVAAPVTYYRPVTVYQPAAAAVVPQSCNYAATTCTTSSCSSSSGWRPFAWLFGSSCSNNTCYKAPQTCYSGCGAAAVPYYTTPTIPTVTAPPVTTVPPVVSPFSSGGLVSPGTIAPPPTRTPGSAPIIGTPADTMPRIPSGTLIPSGPPPGSFGPSAPPTPFSSGTPINPNLRPIITDPYSQPAAPAPPVTNPPLMTVPPAAPLAPVTGAGYREEATRFNDRTNLTPPLNRPNVISQPQLLAPPPSVKPLSDPHADERREPNRAPQLISPSDRTAGKSPRWGVVPAVWPVKAQIAQPVAAPAAPVAKPMQLDDSGWKSAR